MLKELYIKNIVLISELKINFLSGFSVLTGETGAGKSILLDSLSLLLGGRADYSLIRTGSEFAEIIGVLDISNHFKVLNLLKENFIPVNGGDLILKRIIAIGGKSKSFVNDTPVSLLLMKTIGELLIDIHGQFDNHKLFNQQYHQEILDSFLEDKNLVAEVSNLYNLYISALNNYENQKIQLQKIAEEKEYLEYCLEELRQLKPKEGEEKYLLEKKVLLQKSQRISQQIEVIKDILVDSDILYDINKALKQLQVLQSIVNHKDIEDTIQCMENSYISFSSGLESFNNIENELSLDDKDISVIEERIMDLRSIAKKHKVLPNELFSLISMFEEKLNSVEQGEHILDKLLIQKQQCYEQFINKANILSEARKYSAMILDDKINEELKYLKLSSATFKTNIEAKGESILGIDKVSFIVKTNQGSSWGDLNKIASGGEMSRFMLSLKMIISQQDTLNTIIFDEIDIGVGGDVASAIGDRLLLLSKRLQTIVITHSHQVASMGEHHIKVIKEVKEGRTFSILKSLDKQERVQEIARMISGAQITQQAIETAKNLLKY